MSNRATGLKAAVLETMRLRSIPGEMEQSLVKEFVHLHILSAMSEAGVLDHVVFQGGTALRLCYGGDRYSEDIDLCVGYRGEYVEEHSFRQIVDKGLEIASRTLARQFDLAPNSIGLKAPDDPDAILGDEVSVAAWQLIVPLEATPRSPKSRIKVEFANVPSYDNGPRVIRSDNRLAQIPSIILRVETPREILADKAVALTARTVLKYRDVWDVHYLANVLRAERDADMVARKFGDYGTTDVEAKAQARIAELATDAAADGFLAEMRRFLPAREVEQMDRFGMHRAMLAESADLLRAVVAPPSAVPGVR